MLDIMDLNVAIQGIKGSFHEEAALKFFGNSIKTLECNSFKLTCQALKKQEAHYAVMAIENSIAGSLLPNYSLLQDYQLCITGEVYLPIKLHLLALPGVSFDEIDTIESHPIALRQCADFFDEHPHLQVKESNDTAACARRLQEQQLNTTAAVANQLCASLYGLNVLERSIESSKKNYTRFLILSARRQALIEGANKASISFQAADEVGSLVRILNIFAARGVNLSKIQSMPVIGKRNQYLFYLDLDWTSRESYTLALQEALKHCINFTLMGEYIKNDNI